MFAVRRDSHKPRSSSNLFEQQIIYRCWYHSTKYFVEFYENLLIRK